jgi:hypothetical protein
MSKKKTEEKKAERTCEATSDGLVCHSTDEGDHIHLFRQEDWTGDESAESSESTDDDNLYDE